MYIKPLKHASEYSNLKEYLADADRWQKDYQRVYNLYLQQEFDLVYYGRYSPDYIQGLTPQERGWIIKHLGEVKDKEAQAIKDAGKSRRR